MGKESQTATGLPPSGGTDAQKTKKRSFELKEKCQELVADIYAVTSISQKEFRTSLCKKVQDYACEAVHSLRLANSLKIGSSSRKSAQQDAAEMISRIQDLLPVMTRCKCITPEQEKLLDKKVSSLKLSLERWLEKDRERIEEARSKKSSENSVQRKQPSSANDQAT